MPSTTIKLETPIAVHGGDVSEITLKEPGFREIMKYGEPFARGYAADGSVIYTAENVDAIKNYIEALVQAPADALLLNQLGILDTMRLKDAVLRFSGRKVDVIKKHVDVLVFGLKVVTADRAGELSIGDVDYWIKRAVALKLLK